MQPNAFVEVGCCKSLPVAARPYAARLQKPAKMAALGLGMVVATLNTMNAKSATLELLNEGTTLEILDEATLDSVSGGSFRPAERVTLFEGTAYSFEALGGLNRLCLDSGGSFSIGGGGLKSGIYYTCMK